MLQIKLYSLNDIAKIQKKWDTQALSQSNISQTFSWALLNHTARSTPLFLIATDPGGNWIANWLVFSYFVGIGRIIDIPSEPIIGHDQNIQEVYFQMIKFLEYLRPISINWRNFGLSRLGNRDVLENNKFNIIQEYNAYIVDLNKSIESLWNSVHGKHKNNIRFAQNAGIIVEETNDIESYCKLSSITYRRSGKEGPSEIELHNFFNILFPSKMGRIFFARYKNKIMAGAFILCYGDRITYFKGVTANNPFRGASNLLHWELMQLFKAEGYKVYDFGGVSLSDINTKALGIKVFKSRFGGKEAIYYGGIKELNYFKVGIIHILNKLNL